MTPKSPILRTLLVRPRLPKDRVAALLIDWLIWAYLSYCAFFLVNYIYKALIAVSIHDSLTFPSYGWPLAICGSFLIAVFWENLGASIGQKAHGLILLRDDLKDATPSLRLRRVSADLMLWVMTVCAVSLLLAPLVGLGTLIKNLVTQTGVSFIPAVSVWSGGPWAHTLGYTALSLLILLGVGAIGWSVGLRWLRWLWGATPADACWSDRQSRSRMVCVGDLEDYVAVPQRWFKTSSGLMIVLLIAITLCVGWLMVEVDLGSLVSRAPILKRTVGRLLHPDFATFTVEDSFLKESILSGLIETIFMALLATLVGAAIAFPLGFLGARNLMARGPVGWITYTVVRAFFNIFRSIEVLIWAIIFAVWVGFGPFAGVIALAVHTVAALGKLYSEQVESIDPGPVEAMTAVGARRWQTIIYGVIPQIVPSFLAFTMYRWDINVRMGTVIGFVGGGGIGEVFSYYKDTLQWERVGAVILSIIIVVWLMDYASGLVRERIS